MSTEFARISSELRARVWVLLTCLPPRVIAWPERASIGVELVRKDQNVLLSIEPRPEVGFSYRIPSASGVIQYVPGVGARRSGRIDEAGKGGVGDNRRDGSPVQIVHAVREPAVDHAARKRCQPAMSLGLTTPAACKFQIGHL